MSSTQPGQASSAVPRGYDEALAAGAAQYADVLELLRAQGLPAHFTQTGGMCAALEARLEGGAVLLVTDAEGSLAWDRREHRGWGVGLYVGTDEELVALQDDQDDQDGGPAALPPLVASVLQQAPGSLARR